MDELSAGRQGRERTTDIARRERQLGAQKLASARALGVKDTEIMRLSKELEAAGAEIHRLGQQAAPAFAMSCLVMVLVAIGVNLLTSDENQAVGGIVVIIGVSLQVATFFMTKRS